MHEWKENYQSTFSNGCEHKTLVKHSEITWVFEENSFVPVAKIQNGKKYSIISDHLGTPTQAYDEDGKQVWSCELDMCGKVTNFTGDKNFISWRYQGQVYDKDIELTYNRFRWYSDTDGRYISQDPIGLSSGEWGFYNFVEDTNTWVDIFGLAKAYVNPKKNKKTSHKSNSRKAALRQAKRDAGIPMGQQPKKVYHTDLMNGNKSVKDENGVPIQTRNYEFTNSKGETITIQEHSLGHKKANSNDPAAKPHFNVRDSNLETGSVDNTHGHYNFP